MRAGICRTAGRDARTEYLAAHIPGAVRFNIDEIADTSSGLPHTLAPPDVFGRAVGKLGISEDMVVVVYDGAGLFSAPRVWWNFRVMGARDVRVLDGGFPKWKAEKRPVESGEAQGRSPAPSSRASTRVRWRRLRMSAPHWTTGSRRSSMPAPAHATGAKSRSRVPASEPGHMPGSHNVHYASLVGPDGRLKDVAAINRAFAENGVDLDAPVLTTCGSGVSAAILALAVEESGRPLAAPLRRLLGRMGQPQGRADRHRLSAAAVVRGSCAASSAGVGAGSRADRKWPTASSPSTWSENTLTMTSNGTAIRMPTIPHSQPQNATASRIATAFISSRRPTIIGRQELALHDGNAEIDGRRQQA